jgi:hypothetical protein
LTPAARSAVLAALAVVVAVWSINGVYLSALSRSSATAFWAADLAQWVLLPGLLAAVLARRHALLPRDYGLDARSLNLRALAWSVPVTITFAIAYFWVTAGVSAALGRPGGYFSFQDVFPTGAMGTLARIYSALSAGLVESVVFISLPWLIWRGRTRRDAGWFTALWSMVFAAVHWEQGPHVFVAAAVFSVAACAWYFRLGTLWPIIIGHVIVDLIDFA